MQTNDIGTTGVRERMPELVATIGATLVALAVGGFLASTWDQISQVQKSMILGAAAVGLTVAGLWADRDGRGRLFDAVTGIAWATATLLTAAAVTLAASTTWPGYGRATIAAGGVAAAVHALVLWRRRPESITQQVALFLSAMFAAGPFGTALSDRFEWHDLLLLGEPLIGLSDPTFASDAFLLTGLAHLGIGALWLGLGHVLRAGPANAARVIGTLTVGFAALELNVLTSPVGAVAALAVVLGYLLYGVWSGVTALVVAGGIGALIAGARVLAALFSGQVTVTLLVFSGGLAMLAWAFRQSRRRRDGEV